MRTALVITYSMAAPRVVGVLFRALRLAAELAPRGFRVVVLNDGPLPSDPKVAHLPAAVELLPARVAGTDAAARFRSFAPDVVVFGEGPIAMTADLFAAAHRVDAPFVLLDQYYRRWQLERRDDLDLVLLYALRPFWPAGEPSLGRRYRLVPPFIGAVAQTPAPARRVAVLGLDPAVLSAGVALASRLPADVEVVTVGDPERARALLAAHGIAPERSAARPPLPDEDLFGLLAGSRAAVVANGFMQIMESLALGCPVVCVDRGVGLPAWSVDQRFRPYVSIGEPPEAQARRLAGWLDATPFDAPLRRALAGERDGARVVAEHVAALVRSRPFSPGGWLRRRRRVRSGPAPSKARA